MYNITQSDLRLMLQPSLSYLIKVEIFKKDTMKMAEFLGIVPSGSISINSESDVRRTCSITLVPNQYKKENIEISEDGLIWLNNSIRISIGIYNIREDKYVWYKAGTYVFTDVSSSIAISDHNISINTSDMVTMLDGTKNGQVGALTTEIPAYEENEETGEPIKYNIIREAFITILKHMTGIRDYIVDDMGEYKAMPQYNSDWEKYREQNELWNTVPYDLEFSSGCSVLSILQELRDLYPNYEMFFDENNTFICQMIPSNYDDDIVLDNSFIQKILISENASLDMSTVRNICEVWGKVIEADYFTEECTNTNSTYDVTIEGYEEKYYVGDLVAVRVDSTNGENQKLNINGFGALDIIDENTEEPIEAGLLEPNVVYVFKVKNQRIEGESVQRFYYLGHWQAHALSVLTDGSVSPDTYTDQDGNVSNIYSKEYFQSVYNCETVELNIIKDSPFTVQKIGQILDVKTGGEFENITSDSLAMARANYENWKNCRLTDSISITTLLCPFLDVNQKISYQKYGDNKIEQYIIKSVSHDFGGGTSSITMYKFYPLYNDAMRGTHIGLKNYTHKFLHKYTHENLKKI